MLKQKTNENALHFFSEQNLSIVESMPSFTGLLLGKPVVCGGIVPLWEKRGYLWTLFDDRIGHCFVPVFRGIKAFLHEMRPMYNRLEIAVPCDFPKGVRRALLLGFRVEVERAAKFLPDGKDACLMLMEGGI